MLKGANAYCEYPDISLPVQWPELDKKERMKKGQHAKRKQSSGKDAHFEPINLRISAYKQGKHMGFLGFPGVLSVMKREL